MSGPLITQDSVVFEVVPVTTYQVTRTAPAVNGKKQKPVVVCHGTDVDHLTNVARALGKAPGSRFRGTFDAATKKVTAKKVKS